MPSSDTGYAETVMTKAQFLAQVSQVRSCSASLASCLSDEVDTEAMYLRDQLNRLHYAKLARKNPQLEQVRRAASDRATEVMNRRLA